MDERQLTQPEQTSALRAADEINKIMFHRMISLTVIRNSQCKLFSLANNITVMW